MKKWILFLALALLLVVPTIVSAQGPTPTQFKVTLEKGTIITNDASERFELSQDTPVVLEGPYEGKYYRFVYADGKYYWITEDDVPRKSGMSGLLAVVPIAAVIVLVGFTLLRRGRQHASPEEEVLEAEEVAPVPQRERAVPEVASPPRPARSREHLPQPLMMSTGFRVPLLGKFVKVPPNRCLVVQSTIGTKKRRVLKTGWGWMWGLVGGGEEPFRFIPTSVITFDIPPQEINLRASRESDAGTVPVEANLDLMVRIPPSSAVKASRLEIVTAANGITSSEKGMEANLMELVSSVLRSQLALFTYEEASRLSPEELDKWLPGLRYALNPFGIEPTRVVLKEFKASEAVQAAQIRRFQAMQDKEAAEIEKETERIRGEAQALASAAGLLDIAKQMLDFISGGGSREITSQDARLALSHAVKTVVGGQAQAIVTFGEEMGGGQLGMPQALGILESMLMERLAKKGENDG